MGKLDKFKKAPGYIGALLAGALATEAVVHHNQTEAQMTSAESYSAGYQEVTPSVDAYKAIAVLDKTLAGVDLQITTDQVKQISVFIDSYIKEHPPVTSKTEEVRDAKGVVVGFSEAAGYDPLTDLWSAVNTHPPKSPVVSALLLKELSDRVTANVTALASALTSTPSHQ